METVKDEVKLFYLSSIRTHPAQTIIFFIMLFLTFFAVVCYCYHRFLLFYGVYDLLNLPLTSGDNDNSVSLYINYCAFCE